MTQRLISYNYDHNFEREKVSKMNEIENYVSILIQNNKNYADQLNLLRKENTDLRGQIEIMMGEMLKVKENYQYSLNQTKACYSKEIGALIDQLKDILNKKQQMEGSYKSLLEQLSYQSQFERSNRAQQMAELQRNYENKIKILNDRIQQQNKQLQANFHINSDSKMKMVKEIDNLRFDIGELKKENNDLIQSQIYLQNQINRQSLSVKLVSKEKEEMGVNLLKIQQDKNQTIIQLRQSSALLRQQLNQQIDNIKRLQISLITKQKEYQNMTERYQHAQRQKCEYEDIYHKLSIQIGDKEAELSTLKIELNKTNQLTNKDIKKMNQLIKILENDNNRFSREKQELQKLNLQKQEEIYTLLERVQKTERECDMANSQLQKLQQQNSELIKNNNLLKQELQISLLQQKKYSEKCLLQTNHMETLEKIIDKEKRRNQYLQSSTVDRNNGYNKQIAFENQINQRYQFQLQKMMGEKNQLLSTFEHQKERLVRMYQNALHQKQVIFKDKIQYLEKEIIELSK